jgi:hypothetical protein
VRTDAVRPIDSQTTQPPFSAFASHSLYTDVHFVYCYLKKKNRSAWQNSPRRLRMTALAHRNRLTRRLRLGKQARSHSQAHTHTQHVSSTKISIKNGRQGARCGKEAPLSEAERNIIFLRKKKKKKKEIETIVD